MLVQLGRSARDVLADSRAALDPELRTAIDSLPGSMRRVAGYHFGWWDEHGRAGNSAAASSGKALRPALVQLAAAAVGGQPREALPAAVAVELVHNFSLLHDDVMDGDRTRRHRATAWTVFGVAEAILAGDALLTLAADVLLGSGHPAGASAGRMLHAAVLDLLDGQSMDVAFEDRTEVSRAECAAMAAAKTGALVRCSCALGAAFGGGRPDQVERLAGFGARVGLAFQHVDDLLGIWGDPAVTGKPVHADLRGKKKSLPVVAALTSGTPAGAELAALYRGDGPLSRSDQMLAADLVDRAGGRSWSQSQAEELLAGALAELGPAGLTPAAGAELAVVAQLTISREQ